MLHRRTLLAGGALAAVTAVAGTGLTVAVGARDTAGAVPDVPTGPRVDGTFTSALRGGVETGWSIVRPPGVEGPLPLVVGLHMLGRDHASLLEPRIALDRFLASAVRDHGVPPFAVALVDGGRSFWHPRPWGEDAGAMVVEEFLPIVAEHGYDTSRLGLLGWSMGGYGALRLAGLLGPRRVRAVCASSPALWVHARDAYPVGFEDATEYRAFSVLGRQADLDGIAVRIDCGRGDAFLPGVRAYVRGFRRPVTTSLAPGGHNGLYWRTALPGQLAFLGGTVGRGA